ncbi:MAG: sugar transferase [Lachnospiraceae bacterium]|nr:sugar transferase [Lachnospiraceae bacterium]
MYAKFWKRFFDLVLSFLALVVLSPLLLILIAVGAVAMRGNPFFTQLRPGKNEKIFRLIKFRTMDNRRDENGELLPDAVRLNGYGRFLRSTSLDELPELFNILVGDMAIVGPRPLLAKYLPLYNERQHRRHSVRPGLTGWAQVNGRNLVSWEDKFEMDVRYTENIRFPTDVKIIFLTVRSVFKKEGIHAEGSETVEEFKGNVTV